MALTSTLSKFISSAVLISVICAGIIIGQDSPDDGGQCDEHSQEDAALFQIKRSNVSGTEMVVDDMRRREDALPPIINTLKKKLETSLGSPHAFYKGCLKLVEEDAGSTDLDTILDTFRPVCLSGEFHGKRLAGPTIDPNLLKAECRRFHNQVRLQKQLIPDAFSTATGICTIVVETVLPMVQENACLRYIEDITHEVLSKFPRGPAVNHSTIAWPLIIQRPDFPEAFTHECTNTDTLICIVNSTGKPCTPEEQRESCAGILARLQALDLNFKKASIVELLAEVCPILQLDRPEELVQQQAPVTLRARQAMVWEKAALLQRQRGQTHESAVKFKKAGFKQGLGHMLDHSLKVKRSGSGTGGVLGDISILEGEHGYEGLTPEGYCCQPGAYTTEGGIGFNAPGFEFGTEIVDVKGFDRWEGNDCIIKSSKNAVTICGGTGISTWLNLFSKISKSNGKLNPADFFEIDLYFVKAAFNKFSDVPGESVTFGGSISVGGIGFGAGNFYSLDELKKLDLSVLELLLPFNPNLPLAQIRMKPAEIGTYVEGGIGVVALGQTLLGIPPTPSFDKDVTVCDTKLTDTPLEERHKDLKLRCVKTEDECFPADAQVETPSGKKMMKDLRVGDHVLVSDNDGKFFFDVIYFFGHADPEPVKPYMQLQVEVDLTKTKLVISRDHYLPTCPLLEPCAYNKHVFMYAGKVQVGGYVWVKASADFAGTTLQLVRVTHKAMILKSGMYNPYTLSGNIIVNDVLASSHSSWILDRWVPDSCKGLLPPLYQGLFLPGRILYFLGGSAAADFLDMNNPQANPETFGYGPGFLLSVLVVIAAGLEQSFVHFFMGAQPKVTT